MGDQVGPKLGSKLAQVRFQIDIQLDTNLDKASVGNLEPLGLDFEGHLASQIEPESELKTRGVKSAKLDSRAGGSSIFEVQGGLKSMKNRCQDGFKIRPHLKSQKNLKKVPT